MMSVGRVRHSDLVSSSKHYLNMKTFPEKSPRRIFKDRRDVGRGCIFRDPPPCLLYIAVQFCEEMNMFKQELLRQN